MPGTSDNLFTYFSAGQCTSRVKSRASGHHCGPSTYNDFYTYVGVHSPQSVLSRLGEERTQLADQDPLSNGPIADRPYHQHVHAFRESCERWALTGTAGVYSA